MLAHEAEISIVEAYFSTRWPEVEISWMDYEVHGSEVSGDTIHLVTEFTPENPVVVAAFSNRREAKARRVLEAPRWRSINEVRIQSFLVGVIMPGTPWRG